MSPISPQPAAPPPPDVARRRLITTACLLAQFMAAVEATIVGTAMPTIVGDLGGFHLFSWVFAAYLLAQTASTPVYGRLADLWGRKRIFFAGTVLFLLGSAACGFAGSMVTLIVFRGVQGLGAGAVQPIAWTIIGDIYPPAERARMQGWLSSVFGGSAIAGPLLGAFIVEHLRWALVFWINIPVGALAVTMLMLVLDERAAPRRYRIDYLGAGLVMFGVGAVLVALVEVQQLPPLLVAVLAGAGAAALAALVVHELHVAEPIVPFRLWRHPLIAAGNFGSAVIGITMMCNAGYLPAYVQGAMGRSPTVAGIVVGVSSVVWTCGTFFAGRIMIRTSYRTTAVIGGLIVLAGTGVLLLLEPARGPAWAAFGTAVMGLGMGFCNTTFIVAVQTAVGWGERGAVVAANLFMRTMGQTLGAALFGFVLTFGIARRVPDAGDAVNRLLQQSNGGTPLPPALAARLSAAFGDAMHDAYIVVLCFALVLLALAFAIPARLNPARQPVTQPRLAESAADD
jgi:EmrB/QacA subfamily drug resistance transporter